MAFVIAIVGRPNVGKSTLFNRLVGQKLALVDNRPGVTRDRRQHKARLQDLHFDIIDTAGFEGGKETTLEGRMRQQTELALGQADLIFFLVDSRTVLTPLDLDFAAVVRRFNKPTILIANKAESARSKENFPQLWGLGLGEPCAISAEHGLGMGDLYQAMLAMIAPERRHELESKSGKMASSNRGGESDLETAEALDLEREPLRIAVVGRPNVGKSTFINSLLGEERLLTGPEAGLTRDSISVSWQWRGYDLRLYDTAGLRRKARVQEKLEKLSVAETLRAIRFAEIVILIMDATTPFEKQDLQIADLVEKEGRALVLAFNKWDQISDKQAHLASLREMSDRLLPQIAGVRSVAIAAVHRQGLEKLLENVIASYKIWNRRIATAPLNKWLATMVTAHPPPAVANRRLKVKYVTQIKARPPSFLLSCSRKEAMPQSYLRYLIRGLRKDFGLLGVPIRLHLKSSDNPYAHRAKKT